VAFWLGCWGVNYTPTLDTHSILPKLVKRVHKNCSERGLARRLFLEPKERRESGEDKREFEEFLKQEWLEFDRRRKR